MEGTRADLRRVEELREQLPRLELRQLNTSRQMLKTGSELMTYLEDAAKMMEVAERLQEEMRTHQALLERLQASRELLSLRGLRSPRRSEEEG